MVILKVKPRGNDPGFVYLVANHDRSYIKIGYTSMRPTRRFSNVGCWARLLFGDRRLHVIGFMVGSWDLEWEIQKQFRHLLLRYEWYRAAPDLLAYIETLRSSFVAEPLYFSVREKARIARELKQRKRALSI